MKSTVTTVIKIETPQYAAHVYPVNTLITWKRARNATNVGTGFACHAPNTRMMATIIVLTAKETKVNCSSALNVVPLK